MLASRDYSGQETVIGGNINPFLTSSAASSIQSRPPSPVPHHHHHHHILPEVASRKTCQELRPLIYIISGVAPVADRATAGHMTNSTHATLCRVAGRG